MTDPLYDRVITHFDQHEFTYTADAEKQEIFVCMANDHFGGRSFFLEVRVPKDLKVVIGMVHMPLHVLPEHRETMLRHLNRVNERLMSGNFQMDERHGDIVLRDSLRVNEVEFFDPDELRPLFGCALSTADQHLSQFCRLAFLGDGETRQGGPMGGAPGMPPGLADQLQSLLGDCEDEAGPSDFGDVADEDDGEMKDGRDAA